MSKKVVGIDLGTTFSAIAHVNEHARPEIIPNDESDRMTPSVIMFGDDYDTVGKIAKQNARAYPEEIVEFVKREMGRSKEEFFREFKGKKYSAEELSARILKKLKQDAEAYLKTEVTDAVITVPAYFKEAEREATRNAGIIAGLEVLQVLNEPTAAALAYGVDQLDTDQNVFVFDLGGGTFDVTVMEVSGAAIKMVATNGDHRLGGKDWDDKVIMHVAEAFEAEHGDNPLEDLAAYQDIQLRVIQAKETLSKLKKTGIVCLYNGKSTTVELTREKFEELTADLLERCKAMCAVVLSEAGMTWQKIDKVLLVGGSTRMPMVQEMIARISGKEINPHEVNPDEAVALGAAIQGTLRQIDTDTVKQGGDLPEAVQARFIGPGGTAKVKVIDGATHNLGNVIVDADQRLGSDPDAQYIHVMIPKMTPIPHEAHDQFGTVVANQPSVLIQVVQGLDHHEPVAEVPAFEDHKLGECTLQLPSGLPENTKFDLTYKYNLDQTLEVTAKGPDGRTAQVTIKRPTLDSEEVAEAATALKRVMIE